jgi:tRNA pseudouridine13 synthase
MTPIFKIKTINSDFQVFECYAKNQVPEINGNYQYCTLFKSGISTFDAIEQLVNLLKVEKNQITYHGLKDEDAYTQQLISIQIPKDILIKQIEIINNNCFRSQENFCKIVYLYSSSSPLVIGTILGNSFLLTLRGLSKNVASKLEKIGEEINCSIINYYGHQRFGLPNQQPETHIIGKHLLNNELENAMELILKQKKLLNLGNIKQNYDVASFFSQLDTRKKNFFINSHFSSIWNQNVISTILESDLNYCYYNDNCFPLYFTADMDYFTEIIAKHNILQKKIPAESNIIDIRTHRRNIVQNTTFKIHSIDKDALFKDHYSSVVSFFLPSGSYATVAIPQFLYNICLK